ncbi:hypothetical protein GGI35DRAFT_349532 [Trichoderma velutinum]
MEISQSSARKLVQFRLPVHLGIFWSGAWGRCWDIRLVNWIATPWHQLAITKQSKCIQENSRFITWTSMSDQICTARQGIISLLLWLGFNLGPCWPASAWTAATDMLAPVSVSHPFLYFDFMFIFVFVFAACGLLTCI